MTHRNCQKRLRIGLNLLYLIPGQVGGVETYARSLMGALAEQDDGNEYVVFLSKHAQDLQLPQSDRFSRVVAPIDSRNRYARYFWEQCILPAKAATRGLSLLHSLNYVGPIQSSCKTAVTIHDTNFCVVAEDMSPIRRFSLGTFSRMAARRSNAIVTVSEFSKGEILKHLGVEASKVHVIHSGAGWALPASNSAGIRVARDKYALTAPYIVAFGGGYPHKNIPRLIEAYEEISQTLPHKLVIIGRLSPELEPDHLLRRNREKIILLGHIPTADIGDVLAGASTFVFPSLYEGFGFPILEAQRAGVPVVCSRIASLPEIAGEGGAGFFDPYDVRDIARQVSHSLTDELYRNRLISNGSENLGRFSWAQTASKYTKLYQGICFEPAITNVPAVAVSFNGGQRANQPERSFTPPSATSSDRALPNMRYLIHDFAGHPFQIQLSRELARRGHHVLHLYPVGLQGPKGRMVTSENDSERIEVRGIPLASSFRKYSAWRRFVAHRKYAGDLKGIISRERPDVVLSGNTPIDVQAELLWHCKRSGVGFIHWVQDVYSQALEFYLRRKLGAFAIPFTFPFRKLEQWVSCRSDSAIVIAPAFRELLLKWGVRPARITVLENWASLEEVRQGPRQNEWAKAHGLTDKTVFLYSGTLGLKHRPDLLYKLAQSLNDTCKVVVITEGIGRDYLEKMPKLDNLLMLGFQPYEQLSEVLAAADVLIATLEAEAGQFAVPSKILTYMCSGRPVLVAAPKVNLAASIVERSAAGVAVDPDSVDEWINSAQLLALDASLRRSMGSNARDYAERTFDISKIASAFEELLLSAAGSQSSRR